MTALTEDEFEHCKNRLNQFKLKPGQYTDDSSMSHCMADNLLIHGKIDCIDLRSKFVVWWTKGYNNAFRKDNNRVGFFGRTSVGLGGTIG